MSNKVRRKLLKGGVISGVAIAGSELAGGWVKPVVEAVSLPAHAMTSQTPDSFAGAASSMGMNEPDGNPLIDVLVEKAHAGQDSNGGGGVFFENIGEICIKPNGDGTVRVDAVGEGKGTILLSASSVPIGTRTEMSAEFCLRIIQMNGGILDSSVVTPDPTSLIGKLGVIADAYAGGETISSSGVFVTVAEVGARAKGSFEFNDGGQISPFDIPAAPCEAATCPAPEEQE